MGRLEQDIEQQEKEIEEKDNAVKNLNDQITERKAVLIKAR